MKTQDDKKTILARFMEGPVLLEQTLKGMPDSDLDAVPSDGGWTIRQIVHHIADGDDLWKTCIKMAMGNERAEFSLGWYQEQSQIKWSESWAYSKRSIAESLALLKACRNHILQLLKSIPDSWNRSVDFRNSDGTVERVSVGFIVEMQGKHVLHHLEKIKSIRQKI